MNKKLSLLVLIITLGISWGCTGKMAHLSKPIKGLDNQVNIDAEKKEEDFLDGSNFTDSHMDIGTEKKEEDLLGSSGQGLDAVSPNTSTNSRLEVFLKELLRIEEITGATHVQKNRTPFSRRNNSASVLEKCVKLPQAIQRFLNLCPLNTEKKIDSQQLTVIQRKAISDLSTEIKWLVENSLTIGIYDNLSKLNEGKSALKSLMEIEKNIQLDEKQEEEVKSDRICLNDLLSALNTLFSED